MYIDGQKIDYTKFRKQNFTDYTLEICQNLEGYSHPVWGSIALALIWSPVIASAISISNAFCIQWKRERKLLERPLAIHQSNIHTPYPGLWILTIFSVILIAITWPLAGIIL